MRRSYVYRDGKVVEVTGQDLPKREDKTPLVGEGDGRGFSFQLPLGYEHADQHITKKQGALEPGMPCWTTTSQGEDIAKRAQDHGERLQWERTRLKRPRSMG